ncbi:hypothetical protein MKW92_003000 [Papaver armeniacum]|nr:hypothetical protein MKW92_003000 [Papaver armeniacum]
MAAAAGARTLSQILTQSKKLSVLSSSESTSSRFVTTRNLSSKSEGGGGSLIEVNLVTNGENEIIDRHQIGYIFTWFFLLGTPKTRPQGFAELIGKLANPLSEDETLSLNTYRGWPSTSFFIDGKPALLEFISLTPQSYSPHI